MAVKKALRWSDEERLYHRYVEALWPALMGIWVGLEERFVCKRKAWQAGAHLSNTEVPLLMAHFEYRANGRRLNRPPQDGIRKFLRVHAERNGLVLKKVRMGKASCHAELHLPREVIAKLKGGAKISVAQKREKRKKIRRDVHH